jgi:hypothetical protein
MCADGAPLVRRTAVIRSEACKAGRASCDEPRVIKLPLYPLHPERVCWGCDRYCPAHELACGNGSERTPHPVELFGEDWVEWSEQQLTPPSDAADTPAAPKSSEEP